LVAKNWTAGSNRFIEAGGGFDRSRNNELSSVHNLTLVTHNTRDFANIDGLTMADWLEP
jgi:hypothetical protein